MIQFTLRDQAIFGSQFNSGPCAVLTINNGGGNTFDCMNNGAYTTSPVTGTGLTAYYFGDSPFANPFGDTFEDYPDGVYAGGVPGENTTGYTAIIVGDGP